MANKTLILIAFVAIFNIVAADECDCDKNRDIENEALFKFLTKISGTIKNAKEKDIYSVIPGFISPPLECNCLEKNRKKRKILPEVSEVTNIPISPRMHMKFENRSCPRGYARIGRLCFPPSEILDY